MSEIEFLKSLVFKASKLITDDVIVKAKDDKGDLVTNFDYEIETFINKEIKNNYDYIFIDCPPSLGLLTINAWVASDSVIIPLQAEYYALEGVSQLMNTISMVKQHLNPNLVIEGVVITMYDGRANVSRQITAEIKKFFKNKLYEIIIPRNIRLSEAPSHGKPIMLYDPKCVGARAYKALSEEFLSRQK